MCVENFTLLCENVFTFEWLFAYAYSCLTLCNPMNCSPPGSSVSEIFQARILRGLPCPSPGDLPNLGIKPHLHLLHWQVDSLPLSHLGSLHSVWSECMLSHVQLFTTPWPTACQGLLFIEFSRQEYWSVLPFPPPGALPNPGIKPVSLASLLQWRWILYCWATGEALQVLSSEVNVFCLVMYNFLKQCWSIIKY